MKYIAKPIVVEAHRIVRVGPSLAPEMEKILGVKAPRRLKLDDGSEVVATGEMCCRLLPVAGDYWVIQEDGIYLNSKDVFERRFSPQS